MSCILFKDFFLIFFLSLYNYRFYKEKKNKDKMTVDTMKTIELSSTIDQDHEKIRREVRYI